jgi:hypothetical protein
LGASHELDRRVALKVLRVDTSVHLDEGLIVLTASMLKRIGHAEWL